MTVTTTTTLREQHQLYLDAHGDIPGDCWRTAIACLLELPRDDVPHFIHEHAGDDPESVDWWHDTVAFVERAKPGWTLIYLQAEFPVYRHPDDAPKRVVLTGRSPRGDWLHSVIADASTGDIIHDPHPAGGGLLSKLDVAALTQKENVHA